MSAAFTQDQTNWIRGRLTIVDATTKKVRLAIPADVTTLKIEVTDNDTGTVIGPNTLAGASSLYIFDPAITDNGFEFNFAHQAAATYFPDASSSVTVQYFAYDASANQIGTGCIEGPVLECPASCSC